MKGGRIILEGMTFEEFFERLESKQPTAPVQQTSTEDDLLSRDEVCTILKISKTTLNNYTRAGKLQKHCIGNRVLYKRSEVLASVQSISY